MIHGLSVDSDSDFGLPPRKTCPAMCSDGLLSDTVQPAHQQCLRCDAYSASGLWPA